MEAFTALVSWPSAPLTDRLVRRALSSLNPPPTVVESLSEQPVSSRPNILQWSTYDAIDHGMTYRSLSGSKILSSSYIIRKALIRKHYLSRCIHNYLTKHADSVLQRTVPKTWDIDLSFADELDEMWSDDLYDLGQELDDERGAKSWWILKPGMADRGMGIRLFHTKDELTRIFERFEPESDEEAEDHEAKDTAIVEPNTAVAASQLRHFVIQEYLSQPLLLDPSEVWSDGKSMPQSHGHKFHLRVYCVASGALTVYMYTRMLALFSAVPYAAPGLTQEKSTADYVNEDLAAHLTNTSLQTDRGEAGVRLFDELVGCRILSSSPIPVPQPAHDRSRQQRPPRAMGETIGAEELRAANRAHDQQAACATKYEQLSHEDVEDIKSQVAEVLGETFKAALDMSVHFQALPNAFELFGVDFLVTHVDSPSARRKFQVYLLEVNSEPAIELTGPRLTWILEDLFTAIGSVCVVPFFGGSSGDERWEVGETRESLKKCLEVEVRGSRGW
ncbi:TTL-domain-containing protein [Daedalea quercina L-15889]|uniref:TTL-domain-containing protein n=1 Tax=Daedalea quercina L-15889 TaxID=1314783 RepID=A0A165UCM3_9APHY|nr:TTL-domain-containing protein [Daedalea quercina L-15889]